MNLPICCEVAVGALDCWLKEAWQESSSDSESRSIRVIGRVVLLIAVAQAHVSRR